MSKQKWIPISASVTQEQKQEIEQRAKNSGMSVNEYIKARLFVDEDHNQEINKINNLDKWMVKVMAYLSIHVQAIAHKNLSIEELKVIDPKIADVIKRSGFLKDHEISNQ